MVSLLEGQVIDVVDVLWKLAALYSSHSEDSSTVQEALGGGTVVSLSL